jgi:hypothetical protein
VGANVAKREEIDAMIAKVGGAGAGCWTSPPLGR